MRPQTDSGQVQGLVHDLNNRLTALLMILELAADPRAPAEEQIDAIREALRHGRLLAAGLRAISATVEWTAVPESSSDRHATARDPLE